MNNKLIPSALAGAVVTAMVITGCSKPSDDFQTRCDKAKGEVVRENDFEGETLGMAPMAFSAGKGGGSGRSGSRGSSSGSSSNKGGGLLGGLFGGGDSDKKKSTKPKSKAPSTKQKNDGWKLADGSKGTKKPSKKKSKKSKSDDNDFLCVKNDTILFEEDE